jgi:hypothetical protein
MSQIAVFVLCLGVGVAFSVGVNYLIRHRAGTHPPE